MLLAILLAANVFHEQGNMLMVSRPEVSSLLGAAQAVGAGAVSAVEAATMMVVVQVVHRHLKNSETFFVSVPQST